MTLLERLKALLGTKTAFTDDDPSRYQLATSARLIGRDHVRPDFDHHRAVVECRSWVFAAARLNAVAVASQPLRLYVRSRGAGTKLWNTRRTGRRTKAYLSGDLAQLPSRYAMQKAAEYGDDYEIVTDSHPLLTLLAKVNPYQNGYDATVLRVLFSELTGNAYLHPVIDRAMGVPVELWTMPSQWMKIKPGDPARGEPFILGYEYGRNDAQAQDFEPDEVIHFKQPNPRDLYYGLGKVEAAWGAVTSNAALHDMDFHFFKNKSRPDYLAIIKGNASDQELERFTAEVENKLRGTNKTGRFLAVTGEVDLKPLQFPPKDLEGREEIVEEIAAVFGVPVSMLRANDPNLASATVGFASWKETAVLPLLRMDEETLNQSLVPLFGIEDDAFLAYDNPVRADEAQELTKRTTYVAAGVLTINEVRELEGLERIEDPNADKLLVGGQPLGGAPAPASPFAGLFGQAAQPPAPRQVEAVPAEEPTEDEEATVEAKAFDTKDAPVADTGTPPPPPKSCDCCAGKKTVRASDLWAKHDAEGIRTKSAEGEQREINANEARMSRDVTAVFDEQVKEIVALLAKGDASPVVVRRAEAILRERKYQRALVEALAPYLRDALATGVNLGIDTVGRLATNIDFAVERADLAKYAEAESTRLARQAVDGITETTTVRVRELLGDGLEKGETVDELAERVQNWANQQKDEDGSWSRARMVARTEANRAARVAEVEAWSATGAVEGKTWLLAPDPCEFCEAAAKQFGEKAIGLGEPFFAQGATLQGADGGTMILDYETIKGPPLHPNCRCSMQPKLRADLEDIVREIGESGDIEAAQREINLEAGL